MFNITMDKGETWLRFGITLDMVIRNKEYKIVLCPIVNGIFQELKAYLQEHESELFCDPGQMELFQPKDVVSFRPNPTEIIRLRTAA